MAYLKIKIFSLLLLFSQILFAGTSGKVVGRVIDRETSEPLIGCNVIIEGTALGAATDIDGKFLILNVAPGTYRVKAMMIGYTAAVMTDVQINIDLTTTIEFVLTTEVLGGEEVTIVAERPMVTKDLTASTAIVDASTIASLPVTEISEVLELQAGFVDGHLRGGRSGEVAYWVDGIPVTDVYDGSTVIDVNKDAVEEMQLVSGAFNAEYGQAMSGIVNIVTKEGSNKLGGNISLYNGDYLSSHDDIYMNISSFNPMVTKNIDGSIHGSLIPGKLFYFLNARWINFQGFFEGKRIYKPNSVVAIMSDSSGENETYIIGSDASMDSLINLFYLFNIGEDLSNTALVDSMYNVIRESHKDAVGDNKFVPMDWNRKRYGQVKLIWKISPTVKLKYALINDDVIYQDYRADGNRARNYKYNPDGILTRHRRGWTHLLQFNHSLGAKTYYSLGLTQFNKKYNHRTYPKDEESKYVHTTMLNTFPYSFNTGGTDNSIFERRTLTNTLKFDLTSQISSSHLIKSGLEFRQHELNFFDATIQPPEEKSAINLLTDSPFLETPVIMPDSSIYTSRYEFSPIEFSTYFQDKIEFKELIINIGVRFDYFDPKGKILRDPTDPSIYNPIRPENRYYDLNENGIQDQEEPDVTIAERKQHWYRGTTPKWKISPRFGASFPFTDRGVIHFSYGHFFQVPRFEYLYQNPDFDLGQGTGNIGVVGNADLKPEKTVSGELGIQQQIGYNMVLDITGYFRDIRDLTGTRADEIIMFGGSSSYSKLVNSDFAYIRGLVLSFSIRQITGLSGSIDYTFQVARGSASDPEQTRNAIQGGALPEVQMVTLNWDQRHTINTTISYMQRKWSMSIIGKLGSGLPYTPESTQDISSLVTNSAKKPVTWNLDYRASYVISTGLGDMNLFVRVYNLFDHLNHINVYDDSGVADVTKDIQIAKDQGTPEFINTIDEWYRNETFYSSPRRIELGITYGF